MQIEKLMNTYNMSGIHQHCLAYISIMCISAKLMSGFIYNYATHKK